MGWTVKVHTVRAGQVEKVWCSYTGDYKLYGLDEWPDEMWSSTHSYSKHFLQTYKW